MAMKALVVEDDPKVPALLRPKFVALKHTFDVATNLQAARAMLERASYQYAIVDLTIPADEEGDFPDKQYGLMLIREIRNSRTKDEFPIIAMTSYADDGFGLSTELHELGVNRCISKNMEKMASLVQLIPDIFNKCLQTPVLVSPLPAKLAPFSEQERELVIYEDCIEVCGIRVWSASSNDDMRDVLIRLSKVTNDGYEHVSMNALMKMLGRHVSNPLSRPIKDFRDKATDLLAKNRGLACGSTDIIGTSRGYFLQKWIKVRVVKATRQDDDGAPAVVPQPALGAPVDPEIQSEGLNDRQQWVLQQLRNGQQLQLAHIVRHTKKNRSTINRDLKDLRTKGLITTHPAGYYVLGTPADAPQQ